MVAATIAMSSVCWSPANSTRSHEGVHDELGIRVAHLIEHVGDTFSPKNSCCVSHQAGRHEQNDVLREGALRGTRRTSCPPQAQRAIRLASRRTQPVRVHTKGSG